MSVGLRDIEHAALEAMQGHASIAREDSLEFNAFVLRDEETGAHVDNSDNHILMHTAIEESDRTILLAHIESGKTYSVTVGRTLFELGRRPNMRGAIVSAKEGLAVKPLRAIKGYIENSPELKMVYPNLRKGPLWRETQIIVERQVTSRDPSVIALGVGSQFLGSRLDWVIADDILTVDNTKTKYRRDEVYDWWHATVMGRLVRGAKVILVNTAWHKEDLLHRLARRKMWFCVRFPVAKKVDGKLLSSWPSRWPVDRIEAAIEELGGPQSKEVKKQLMVEAVDEEDATFNEAYIQQCLARGEGLSLCSSLDEVREMIQHVRPRQANRYVKDTKLYDADMDVPIFHGVDLGARRNPKSGKTVFFSIALLPDGTRVPFRILLGNFGGPQIRDLIVDTNESFGGIFMVENNATQQWIIEFTLEQDQLPIIPFTTGSNKANPEFGLESLSTEFSTGSWAIPCDRELGTDEYKTDDVVGTWLDGLRDHDSESHTADTTMASWFAREAARRIFRSRGSGRSKSVGVRIVGGSRRR